MNFTGSKFGQPDSTRTLEIRRAQMKQAPGVEGITVSLYAKHHQVSRWVAANHQMKTSFPDPIHIVGEKRKIRYYRQSDLDEYFSKVQFFHKKKGDASIAKVIHAFILGEYRPDEMKKRVTECEIEHSPMRKKGIQFI